MWGYRVNLWISKYLAAWFYAQKLIFFISCQDHDDVLKWKEKEKKSITDQFETYQKKKKKKKINK